MPHIYARQAPSLGALEGTPYTAWGTPEGYKLFKPMVFFGLYDLRDYLALWLHRGKSWVLWAGSDIRNLEKGFVLNDGKLKWISRLFGNKWVFKILKKAEHWVENDRELVALKEMGVAVQGVCPSFMGRVNDFEETYDPAVPMNVYVTCSGDRQEEYGFGVVERIAKDCPRIRFHLYGADWETEHENIIVHGRVPKEQMNEEIENGQCALRLNEFDGFSEILAKAVLQGQYAIGKVKHPQIPSYTNDFNLVVLLNKISHFQVPNPAREWYRENLNNYPWKGGWQYVK